MIIKNERLADALKESIWFASMHRKRKDVQKRVVSIENIVIERIFGPEDYTDAFKYVKLTLFSMLNTLNSGYSLYLMENCALMNKNSLVENYKKVWKRVAQGFDIEGFVLGEEVKMEIGDRCYYSSFAKVNITDFEKVFEIARRNKYCTFIILSKDDKYLTANETERIFHMAFDRTYKKSITLDNYKMSLEIPVADEMFVRWMEWIHEMEVGIVYNPDYVSFQD